MKAFIYLEINLKLIKMVYKKTAQAAVQHNSVNKHLKWVRYNYSFVRAV